MTGSRAFAAVAASGGGVSVLVEGTGFVDSGDITCTDSAFTALGPDVTITAAAGDVLHLVPDLLVDTTGNDMQIEAATRVGGANETFWSSGTGTSRFPGGLGVWYMPTGYRSPGSALFVVTADDVVAGEVTVRLLGRVSSGFRNVHASTSYPLRWWLFNVGPGV